MNPVHLIALLLVSSSSNSTYTPGLPGGGIIAWIVCYRSRRSPIGGWLMLYYWQLYGGILLTGIFLAGGLHNYVPEAFGNASLYHLFLLSILPVLLLYAIEVVVGTMLLSVHSWELLKLLRWVLIAQLAACVLAIIIDSQKFPDSLFFDAYDAIFPVIWSFYLFRSERVKHVFRTRDWDVAVKQLYPLSPAPTA